MIERDLFSTLSIDANFRNICFLEENLSEEEIYQNLSWVVFFCSASTRDDAFSSSFWEVLGPLGSRRPECRLPLFGKICKLLDKFWSTLFELKHKDCRERLCGGHEICFAQSRSTRIYSPLLLDDPSSLERRAFDFQVAFDLQLFPRAWSLYSHFGRSLKKTKQEVLVLEDQFLCSWSWRPSWKLFFDALRQMLLGFFF